MTVQETEHPAADVLRVLAISRSSGALEVRGVPGGAFFLHEGEVTYAETAGVPPVPETVETDPALPSMIRSTIVEAGVEMLSAPRVENDRPLFRPGRRHWTGLRHRFAVEQLLAEITDLLAHFTRLGVTPDDEVRLSWLPRGRTVVIDSQQWALTSRLTSAQSPRTLARRSGIPLTATLTSIAAMIASGVAKLVQADPNPTTPTAPPARRRAPRHPTPALWRPTGPCPRPPSSPPRSRSAPHPNNCLGAARARRTPHRAWAPIRPAAPRHRHLPRPPRRQRHPGPWPHRENSTRTAGWRSPYACSRA